ncbi:MAG: hypothetical protein IJO79_07035, partial [Firmicutes bacterium]|nr:hypothetical protein [Bacillota bacterium]
SNQTSAGIVANINSWSTEDCSGIIIEDVYNRGSVVTAGADSAYSSAAAGGIIGTAHDEGGKITIRNAFHMGSLSCNTRNMGAIAGSAYNLELSDDLYYQKMQGLDGVGGGYMFDAETGYGWEYDESLMVGLTRSQLADPASFEGFDFDEVWTMSMGHPVLQGCGLEGAVIPSKGYYVALTDKFFRISDPTVGYPQPNDFTVSVGNMDFRTGALRELGIPVDLAEGVNVVVSKDGYHTYTLPQELITSYNVITMTPSSVTGPFAESLLLDKSSGSYKGYTNLRADGESVYESDLSHRDSQRIYVSVNWNGHGDGFVWLEQDGEKLNLLDGGFTPVEIGSVFTAGPSIYLCGEAEDGTTFRHSTKLSVLARHVTDGIDMGIEESLTVDGSLDDNLGFLDSQSFALNFSALSGGAVPLKVKIDGETIKGTIGVSAGKEEYEKKSDGSSKHEQDNMFDMVKEFVDLYKKGSGPDGETLLELQLDKKLKELKKATEIGAVPSSTGVEGEIQVLGYFVGSIVNGEPVLSECSIVLLFEGKVYHVAPFVLGTYPGYLKTELGAALEVILADWKYDRATRKLKKTEPVTINTDIDLSIEAALGWEGIFSGGVKGHGQVHVGFTVPSVKNSTKLSLQGDIALVGNLLGIPGEWVIVRSKEMIFYQNGAWCWTSAAKSYSLRNTVALMAADPEVAASLFDAEDDRVWRSDIFTGGQAAMTILADGTRILVWQESLENHDDGALFYSVGKNGQWSEPVQLDEDATSDFAPVLKKVNGNVYLLWSDLNADLDTSEDLLEIASATDLSVAKFNGTTFDLLGSSVGEDSALDQNPDIQEVLGTPVLTWTSTPVTEGVLGEASVKYASFDGENWTAYEEGADLSWDQASASEDLPDVGTTFTVLNLGVETAVVYAQDGIVYGLFNDGGGWGSPMILEELPTDAVVYSLSADRD